jgi:hypothetical protein
MGESWYTGEIVAGLVYLIAGVRLYQLSAKTDGLPERLLSWTFLLWSPAYLGFVFAYALLDESRLTPFVLSARLLFHAGTLAIALFTRQVFRSQERWAGWLITGTAVCLLVGVGGSVSVGDWEGAHPLSNPWYWVERLGGAVPFAWMGAEGFVQFRKARQRLRLGLCKAIVCNRYLLWSLAGTGWLLLELVVIAEYTGYETTGEWSYALGLIDSALEFLPVALIWLAFFPPALYRRWINGATATAELEEV